MADNGEDQVLNADEAAELLRVSVQTVLKESREGNLPGTKVGREWRYSRRALMNHLARYVGEPAAATAEPDEVEEARPPKRRRASG